MFDSFDCSLGLGFTSGKRSRDGKMGVISGDEKPCWLLRRAGFSKIDDLCEIVNYLLASLVRSSFAFSLAKIAKVGRVSVAWTPNPKPGFPMRRNIPAQRNHAVACECIGYVWNDDRFAF